MLLIEDAGEAGRNHNLELAVLERVAMVYRLRRLSRPLMVKGAGLAGLLALVWFQISLWDVVVNSPSPTRPGAFYFFVADAFQKTEWLVRFLILSLTLMAIWLSKDLLANLQLPVWRFNLRPGRYLHFFRF